MDPGLEAWQQVQFYFASGQIMSEAAAVAAVAAAATAGQGPPSAAVVASAVDAWVPASAAEMGLGSLGLGLPCHHCGL